MPDAAKILGLDSLAVPRATTLKNAASATYLGQPPAFWGRYFHRPGQINSSGKKDSMYSAKENAFLRANNIRLLPVARQTGRVDGTGADGAADARHNVDAIYAEIPPAYLAGADPKVLVYLDVEGGNPLSAAYYRGWSETLLQYSQSASHGHVTLRPALYSGPLVDRTWTALRTALGAGAACFGAWMARYPHTDYQSIDWDEGHITPTQGAPIPILAWQYWESANDAPAALNFDTTLVSPFHSDVFLNGLIMPPP